MVKLGMRPSAGCGSEWLGTRAEQVTAASFHLKGDGFYKNRSLTPSSSLAGFCNVENAYDSTMDKPHDAWLDKEAFQRIFIRHILGDIEFCLQNKRHHAAAQLLLSAIDTTAGLARPLEQEDTTMAEFIAWADEFLGLKGRDYELGGADVYAAGCGFLHGYTPMASMISKGKANLVVWADELDPPVATNDERRPVIVSLRALAAAYGKGLAETMKCINRDEDLLAIVNERMRQMFYADDIPPEMQERMEALKAAQVSNSAIPCENLAEKEPQHR